MKREATLFRLGEVQRIHEAKPSKGSYVSVIS